jgi:hypothetical protein
MAVRRFVVLVAFDVTEKRHDLHLGTSSGDGLYHVPIGVGRCIRKIGFVMLVFHDTFEQRLVVG